MTDTAAPSDPPLDMTDFGAPVSSDPQLGGADIRRLFDQLSSHLRDAGSSGHHLMIAGGAALALMWEDRTTHDVDVLEHRFRAPPDPERRTTAVDFISMRLSADVARAARLVADAEGLPPTWLNGAVAVFTPGCELHPRVLHRTDCLTVEAPSPAVLLAMKLYAARDWDLQDAARLARDTQTTDTDQLLALVADAYGANAATAETADFAHRALTLAQGHTRHGRRRPPDRGFSAGL